MKKVFNGSGEWYMTSDSYGKSVKGVLDYAENEPIDTSVVYMNQLLKSDSVQLIFNRKPENITVKSVIPGYLSQDELDREVESRRKTVTDSVRKTVVVVPED